MNNKRKMKKKKRNCSRNEGRKIKENDGGDEFNYDIL
jgi:hypothetical protein